MLHDGDAPPVILLNAAGRSPFVVLCDHAGRAIPRALGTLGVAAVDMDRHIAWDIGAAEVARRLGDLLDAPVVLQTYSRLVIDCNRAPGHPTSIARVSDGTVISGNQDLADEAVAARQAAIFFPYHDAIAELLDRRQAAGAPVVVAMHSFTPIWQGRARIWHAGVLHDRQADFAVRVGAALRSEPGLHVGDNEPYQLSDESDYTIPRHAEARGLDYVEMEVRQDLIASAEGQAAWAARVAAALLAAR